MTHSLQKFLQFPHMLKFLAGIFIGKIFLGLENMGKVKKTGCFIIEQYNWFFKNSWLVKAARCSKIKYPTYSLCIRTFKKHWAYAWGNCTGTHCNCRWKRYCLHASNTDSTKAQTIVERHHRQYWDSQRTEIQRSKQANQNRCASSSLAIAPSCSSKQTPYQHNGCSWTPRTSLHGK